MKDPVTLKRYNRWYEAEQARDHLKGQEEDAFIIFGGPLAGMEAQVDHRAFPSVQLVTRVDHANKALELLEGFKPIEDSTSNDSSSRFSGMSFYRQSAWMVTVFSLFYIISFLVKGIYTSAYLVPAGLILLTAAIFFFCCLYIEKRKSSEVLGQPSHQV